VLGVREAVEAYPIFSGITRFDVGSARVMSLDLQDIAIQGGQKATQQTALAYMIAREAFMKKIAFSKEDVPTIPEKYRAYYEKLISVLTDSQKIMCMDEYHKTGNQPMLRQQLLTDGREARKWMLEIVLASQLPEDFGDDLTKIATAIFVLDSGTPKTRKYLRESIELSKVEETAMVQHVHGPSSRGTTFLARFETKQGAFTQLFTCCIGPMRLWALSTTAEDRRLRGLLYDAIPRPVARRMLADRFPGGSCKALVERMRNELMGDSAFTDDEERDRNIVEKMADDMINDYMSGKYGVGA
jgi:intracellular multiplication protein IcmB